MARTPLNTQGQDLIVLPGDVIRGQDPPSTNDGDPLNLRGGNANTDGVGGPAEMRGGDGIGSENGGGDSSVIGGTCTDGNGGAAKVIGGAGVGTARTGGTALVQGGAAGTNAAGGTVSLVGVDGDGTGNGGDVKATCGDAPGIGTGGSFVVVTGDAPLGTQGDITWRQGGTPAAQQVIQRTAQDTQTAGSGTTTLAEAWDLDTNGKTARLRIFVTGVGITNGADCVQTEMDVSFHRDVSGGSSIRIAIINTNTAGLATAQGWTASVAISGSALNITITGSSTQNVCFYAHWFIQECLGGAV